VAPHQNPDLRAVTLSFKRLGQAPGDADAEQLDAPQTWPTSSAPARCA
jgi:sulfite reductase (NADPH) hemoprotein beta-component